MTFLSQVSFREVEISKRCVSATWSDPSYSREVSTTLLIGAGIGYSVSVLQISTLRSEKSSLESQFLELRHDYDQTKDFLCQSLPVVYRERDSAEAYTLGELIEETQKAFDKLEADIASLYEMSDGTVCVLADEEYCQSIINDLQNADKTITVAMYSMTYDPDDSFDWGNDLIRELVYASQRGVLVRVVIEYATHGEYLDQNLEAYTYLQKNNVDVRLDYATTVDHLKLVLIDDELVYVGSHDRGESTLYCDHETSVKIISENIAKTFRGYLETTFGF